MGANINSIWTRDFLLHGLSYFLISISFYLLLPTLPIYVVEALGEDKSKIGYIIGIYSISALAIRPLSGYALDAFGRRKIYLLGLAFFTFFMFCYFFTWSFLLLMLVRLGHGLTWGVVTTGGATVASDIVPSQRRGEGLGYFGLTITLAMALGPVAGLWLLEAKDFDFLFACGLITSFIGLSVSSRVNFSSLKKQVAHPTLGDFFDGRVAHVAIVMLFAAFTYAGMISFVTLYGSELGLANPGAFFLVYAIGVAIVRPYSGKLMDKHGPALLIVYSFLMSISGLVILSYINSEIGFLSSGFIIGLGNGIIMPTVMAMVINLVPANRRGVANATLYSAMDLGIAVGSVILGYISEFFSISIMYRVCGLMLFLPLAYFLLFTLKDYNQKVNTINQ